MKQQAAGLLPVAEGCRRAFGAGRLAARGRTFACAGAIAAAALAAAGCATVPTSGSPQPAPSATGPAQQYPQPIAVGPKPGWSAQNIVSGYLHASASFFNGHAVARRYLTPQQSKAWSPGWAADVVANPQVEPAPQRPSHIVGEPGPPVTNIGVSGQRLATLTDSGQYETSSSSTTYHFTLVKQNGQFRISRLPSNTSLLLTKLDFVSAYTPHNLYFFAQSRPLLVPDPVFVPQPATNTDVATGLITGLLAGPPLWLSGATTTDFPPRTKLQSVKINGSSVVVDLGGTAARASQSARMNMAAQLVWTFTSPSYSPSFIALSVVLEINGVVQHLSNRGPQLAQAQAYEHLLPAQQAAGPLYFLAGGAVSRLPGGAIRTVPGLAGHPFTGIAISPDGSQLAGVVPSGSRGCTVYSGPLGHGSGVQSLPVTGGACTAPSWDSDGDIWVASGGYLWMLRADRAVLVSTPLLTPGTISALQVAPDGVRVAMIIQPAQGGPQQVTIGAISRSGPGGQRPYVGTTVAVGAGITGPTQLAWYDADNILVLAMPARQATLYQVPVNGDASSQIQAASGIDSITSNGAGLAAGTVNGQILQSAGLNAQWRISGRGRVPAYPG
jgi:hypothetical protein